MASAKSSTTLVAIDPGLYGAFAVFEGGKFTYGHPLPLTKMGGQNIIDSYKLMKLLPEKAEVVVLEQVSSMPRDGSVSAFKFGRNTGQVLGCLQLISEGEEVQQVSPSVWKKATNLTGLPKGAAIDEAKKVVKHEAFWKGRTKKVNEGLADAIMIGWYWLNKKGPQ